jgi:Domain of unknown function (DUF1905)/Bacteriocin-protection, YdeI or OmpD-Associated
MPNLKVTLYIRIVTPEGKRKMCKPVYASRGRLKPLHAQGFGYQPDGEYYLRYAGKWEAVGTDPYVALDRLEERKTELRGSARADSPTNQPHTVERKSARVVTLDAAITEFRTKLKGDDSRADASASFTLPFDTREVWSKAKVPVRVTINGYTWRSTVGNRGGIQYIVVNADARRGAGVKAGDFVTITLAPDTEKREIKIRIALQRPLAKKLTQKLNNLSFTHKKEFIVWYSEAKKEETRARRVEKMKGMLSAGKVIS